MNKLAWTLALANSATAQINSQKGQGSLLDLVTDDNGNEIWWIMAPKPTYEVPFDLRTDELVIIQAEFADQAGVINGNE